MYEWLTILSILTYQKYKSLGEIMYNMNTKGIESFRLTEMINFIIYVSLVVTMVTLKILGDYYWLKSPKYILEIGTLQFGFIESTDIIPVILLTIVFSALVIQMKHYHNQEWRRLRKSIYVFYFVEIILILYIIVSDFALYGDRFHTP